MDAQALDNKYKTYRERFAVPSFQSLGIESPEHAPTDPAIYFCGNLLGLMPKSTPGALTAELDAWAARGVESHFNHPGQCHGATPWVDIDLPLVPLLAEIVGGKNSEVAAMGSLTANLNAMLTAFYKPQGQRTKILFEKHAFPSDYYAFLNMVKLHGYDELHLVQLEPQAPNTFLTTDDIVACIHQHSQDVALVCLPGIQYYTGQWFDMETITREAHKHGMVVGWDLAHAVGNVPLRLHDWNVDFAVWCSYKYLNAGPGAIGGIFVHEKYTCNNSKADFAPRLAGWWGNNADDRFKMLEVFDPIQTALSYRQSNPSVLDCVALKSALEVFRDVGGLEVLRAKSVAMTGYMEKLLTSLPYYLQKDALKDQYGFKILTPGNKDERGCQLSLLFQPHYDDKSANVMEQVNEHLHSHGIVCDERRPDVIRLAPVPLYNTFGEVKTVVRRLGEALARIRK